MRATLLALLLFGAAACSPCVTRSDCDEGEYCNFTTGDCERGCESNADCGRNATCNAAKGQCELKGTTSVLRDGGTTTSTAGDAG